MIPHRLSATLIALALLAAGCATEPHMAPTPAIIKDSRLAFRPRCRRNALDARARLLRHDAAAVTGPEHFGNDAAEGVALGFADVRLGDPGWTWDDLLASNQTSSVDKPRIGAVESVKILGSAGAEDATSEADRAFVAAIDAQLARIRNQNLVVYVHGYRVTFDEVAVQMGSFALYLGQGAIVTFQWPTGVMFWNYVTDCPRAQRYIPDIERLLMLLARSKAEHVNVMAYSCGSPLLASALARLRARHPELDREALQRRYRLGDVIFVASDVDLKTFARDHVQPALDLSRQVIVYFSTADRALGFSSNDRRCFAPRPARHFGPHRRRAPAPWRGPALPGDRRHRRARRARDGRHEGARLLVCERNHLDRRDVGAALSNPACPALSRQPAEQPHLAPSGQLHRLRGGTPARAPSRTSTLKIRPRNRSNGVSRIPKARSPLHC